VGANEFSVHLTKLYKNLPGGWQLQSSFVLQHQKDLRKEEPGKKFKQIYEENITE